jgi:hypothetical protein
MRLAIAGGSDTLFARWRETDAGDASARDATSLIVGCFNGQSLRNRFPYEQKPVSDASPNFGPPSAKAEAVSDFWVVLKLCAAAEWLQIGAERGSNCSPNKTRDIKRFDRHVERSLYHVLPLAARATPTPRSCRLPARKSA